MRLRLFPWDWGLGFFKGQQIATNGIVTQSNNLFLLKTRTMVQINFIISWPNHVEWPLNGMAGQQLRKSEQNGFHDNFLISQPNPMMWPSLKSSLRDDSNEWSHHRVWLRNKKVSILITINFRPYLLPWLYFFRIYCSKLTFFKVMQTTFSKWPFCIPAYNWLKW